MASSATAHNDQKLGQKHPKPLEEAVVQDGAEACPLGFLGQASGRTKVRCKDRLVDLVILLCGILRQVSGPDKCKIKRVPITMRMCFR